MDVAEVTDVAGENAAAREEVSDVDIRTTERKAGDDPEAEAQLRRQRCRHGQCCEHASEVQRLRLVPGDILVIKADLTDCPGDHRARLMRVTADVFKEVLDNVGLGDGKVPVVVMQNGYDLVVVSQEGFDDS